jgi:predicted small metal-binding protein
LTRARPCGIVRRMTLVVHCECGANPSGETEDELVDAVQAHVKEAHPEMADSMTRDQILEMAHDH